VGRQARSDAGQQEALSRPRRSFGLRVAGPLIGIKLWQSGGRSQGFPRCNRLLERALLYPV